MVYSEELSISNQKNKMEKLQKRRAVKPVVRNTEKYQHYTNYNRSTDAFNKRQQPWYYRNTHNQKETYPFKKRPQRSKKPYSRPIPRPPSRPPSPLFGTEEYTQRKIQKTSEIIMKQLLNPQDQEQNSDKSNQESEEKTNELSFTADVANNKVQLDELSTAPSKLRTRRMSSYNIEEIHNKIVSHILNLNDGRRKNLINSTSSGYDIAIQQIQKQKRLDISRALRNMRSAQNEQNQYTEFINSIIPDIGIKIEDLPTNVIDELRSTLEIDIDFSNDSFGRDELTGTQNNLQNGDPIFQLSSIKCEPPDDWSNHNQFSGNAHLASLKKEVIEEDNVDNTLQHYDLIQQNINTLPNTHNYLENAQVAEKENSENITRNSDQQSVDIEPYYFGNNHSQEFSQKNIVLKQDKSYQDVIASYNTSEVKLGNCPKHTSTSKIMKNVTSQTELNDTEIHDSSFASSCTDIAIQTDIKDVSLEELLDKCLKTYQSQLPNDLTDAINIMMNIDDTILKLTKFRQNMLKRLQNNSNPKVQLCEDKRIKKKRKNNKTIANKQASQKITKDAKEKSGSPKRSAQRNKKSKSNIKSDESELVKSPSNDNEADCERGNEKELSDDDRSGKKVNFPEHSLLDFNLREKMLVIKVIDDKLLAATESGKIYLISLDDGHTINTLDVTNVPITSLCLSKFENNHTMYVGSFDTKLFMYDFQCLKSIKEVSIDDSVQCMEICWGYLFMGGIRGSIIRYSLKKDKIEFSENMQGNSILVLKPTLEGARKVLLIGTRNFPVCVRDAMTGLQLRIMEGFVLPTVYSLVMEKSLVYIGTTTHDILVFRFHDGNLIHRHKATNSRGIACMKIVGNLLFASCHNGQIFVYNTKSNKFIDSIQGPGGVILSMEVVYSQIIVGTMSFQFKAIPIPQYILRQNNATS